MRDLAGFAVANHEVIPRVESAESGRRPMLGQVSPGRTAEGIRYPDHQNRQGFPRDDDVRKLVPGSSTTVNCSSTALEAQDEENDYQDRCDVAAAASGQEAAANATLHGLLPWRMAARRACQGYLNDAATRTRLASPRMVPPPMRVCHSRCSSSRLKRYARSPAGRRTFGNRRGSRAGNRGRRQADRQPQVAARGSCG